MTVSIFFPLTIYLGFLGRCILRSREYAVLKHGVVDQAPDASRGTITSKFHCALEDAELLLARAKRLYPAAAPYIAEAVQRIHEGNGGGPV